MPLAQRNPRGFRGHPERNQELIDFVLARTKQVDPETQKPITLRQALAEFARDHGLSPSTVTARWYALRPASSTRGTRRAPNTGVSRGGRDRSDPGLIKDLGDFLADMQAVEGVNLRAFIRGLALLAHYAKEHVPQATPAQKPDPAKVSQAVSHLRLVLETYATLDEAGKVRYLSDLETSLNRILAEFEEIMA